MAILELVIGIVIGAVVMVFVYRNNKTKLDEIAKTIENEVDSNETIKKIKDLIKNKG